MHEAVQAVLRLNPKDVWHYGNRSEMVAARIGRSVQLDHLPQSDERVTYEVIADDVDIFVDLVDQTAVELELLLVVPMVRMPFGRLSDGASFGWHFS